MKKKKKVLHDQQQIVKENKVVRILRSNVFAEFLFHCVTNRKLLRANNTVDHHFDRNINIL